MNKILLYITLLSCMMISCEKTSYVAMFDKSPQERIADQINLVTTTLTSAQNGWIGTLPTSAGGGYSFYLTFDKDQNVSMVGDMTEATAKDLAKSYYRVKQDMGAELLFDSYNYISMLNDPNGILGGASKVGYSSDIEFTFTRVNGDSIVFVGKKYRQPFKLVKATAAQKASYESGALKLSMERIKKFFADVKYPYIEMGTGTEIVKAGISADLSNTLGTGKRMSMLGVKTDNVTTLSSTGGKFAFTLDGAELLNTGLQFNNTTFVKIVWKDATTLAYYDQTGKEYIVKSSTTPLTPLPLLFGFQTTFPYKKITIGGASVVPGGALLPAGVTSTFNTTYQAMVTRLGALNPARTIVNLSFTLTSPSVAVVTVSPNNGTTTFGANATFNYTITDGVITLTNPIYDGNWTARGTEYDGIKNFFLSGPFKIDWVASSNPTNTSLMGGLYRVADATSFFYGTL